MTGTLAATASASEGVVTVISSGLTAPAAITYTLVVKNSSGTIVPSTSYTLGGSGTSQTVSGLANGTYTFEITASAPGYANQTASADATVAVAQALAQPATFTGGRAPTDGVDTWQVALNWSAVDHATGYQIRYQMTKNADGTDVTVPTWQVWNNSVTTPLTGTTTTITGLVLGATYSFEIVVANSTNPLYTSSEPKVVIVAISRDLWWEGPGAWSQQEGENSFGSVAATKGTTLNFTQPGSITITDYYALGSTIAHSGGGNIHIENFWVTTDTWKGGTTIQLSNGSTATIGTYILQVGSSLISINGAERPFGNEDERYNTVAMNATTFRTKHAITATVADGHFITNSTDDAPSGDERLNAAPGHANNPYGAGIGPFVDGAYQGSYRLENYATVGFVDVRNGSVNNYASSTIEALLLHYNHYRNTSGRVVDNNMGQVDVATVVTGTLNNRDGGNIDYLGMRNTVANRQDPAVVNNSSTIGSAMVNYGILNNDAGGAIESLAIFADGDGRTGTVNNSGLIGSLIYTVGKFAGNNGTIGNLTIAGDSTGIQWGTVGNLSFANDGSGILTIKGYADDARGIRFDAGFQKLSSVNLTAVKLVIDLGDIPTGDLSIDWSTLLGLTDMVTVTGWEGIDTITIIWGTEQDTVWDVNQGGWLDSHWQIDETGITFDAPAIGRLPQPATFTVGTPAPSEGVDTWQVALNWSAVTNATGYQIRYMMTNDTTGAVVPSPTWEAWNNSVTTPLTGTTTTVTGLVLGATYSFEIVAMNSMDIYTPSTAKVVAVSIVRDVWQSDAAGTNYSGNAYGNVGGTAGTARFDGTGAKTITNFYTMDANIQHTGTDSGDTLHIENYWVTPSTFGLSNGLGKNVLDFTSVTIGNYIVQVGQSNVDIDGESYVFGTTDYLDSISPQANNIRTATTVVEVSDGHFIIGGISGVNVDPVNRNGSHGNNLYNATWDWCYVENYGTIGLVDMRNGFANNNAGGTIEALLLHQNYTENNPDGVVNNWGQVDVATVRNATLNNSDGGNIDYLGMRGSSDSTIPAGVVNNSSTIGSAMVNWGTLNNDIGGEIELLAIFADNGRTGTVNNSGSIGSLTYTAGSFAGNDGTIGNLTIAGDSAEIQWGTVGNLSFANDGSGVLTIKGYADDAGGFGFDAGFQELGGVNLTGARLVIDLRDIPTGGLSFDKALENGIDWATLLGLTNTATVTGWEVIDTITVGWGAELHTVWDVNQGGLLNPHWQIDEDGITF